MATRSLAFAATALLCSCAFDSTATQWYGRVDVDGRPFFVNSTTNIGVNLLTLVPLLGNTTIGTMLTDTAGEPARAGSDGLRVIQASAWTTGTASRRSRGS